MRQDRKALLHLMIDLYTPILIQKTVIQYYEKIKSATDYILSRVEQKPRIAIVLGTGLGAFADQVDIEEEIKFSEIPHFPKTTVSTHNGRLLFGRVESIPIVAQTGRLHFYEGYSMKEITLPIRVYGMIPVKALLMASAVGGVHPDYHPGDITVVNDHINLHPENPLRGLNDKRLGPRFPDMSDAYDPTLIELVHQIAGDKGITLFDSIYAGLQGPNLETKAEYEYLHRIGATVVGMSTVPEVIVARHMSIPTCVFTAVTNKCYPIKEIRKVSMDKILENAGVAESKISKLLKEMIPRI